MTASSAYGVRYRSVPETIAFLNLRYPLSQWKRIAADGADDPDMRARGVRPLVPSYLGHPRHPRLFFGFFEIDHPIDTKLICQRPKASAPERILQRHRDFAFFS